MSNPTVHVYRQIKFDYASGELQVPQQTQALCGCVCGNRELCTGIDAFKVPDAVEMPTLEDDTGCTAIKTALRNILKMTNQNSSDESLCNNPNVRKACPIQCTPSLRSKLQDIMKTNTGQTHECDVCNGIQTALSNVLTEDKKDFAVDFLLLGQSELEQSLKSGSRHYATTRATGNASIQEAITHLEQKRARFQAQAEKIRALKNKVRVATEVLHSATDKLGGMGASFNTLEQQNGLQYKDRVPVGIPYLPPFFTLSNRNYVIMMVCINVLLLAGIIAYAFIGRVRTDADVVAMDPTVEVNDDAAEDNSEGHASASASASAEAPAPSVEPTPASATENEPESSSSSFDGEPEAALNASDSSDLSEKVESAPSHASASESDTERARGGRGRRQQGRRLSGGLGTHYE